MFLSFVPKRRGTAAMRATEGIAGIWFVRFDRSYANNSPEHDTQWPVDPQRSRRSRARSLPPASLVIGDSR